MEGLCHCLTLFPSKDVKQHNGTGTLAEWLKSWGEMIAQLFALKYKYSRWRRRHNRCQCPLRSRYYIRYYIRGNRRAGTSGRTCFKSLDTHTRSRLITKKRSTQLTACHSYGFANLTPTFASEPYKFDTESFVIAIDNCSTVSMTNDKSDFISPPKQVREGIPRP